MATYNKRGYKPKTKKEKEVQEEIDVKDSTTAEVFESLDQGASRTEEWVEKNQRPILYGIVGILVVVLAFLAYTKFVSEPKEVEAASELAQAQESFNTALDSTNETVKDSLYTVALSGSNGKYGLLDIVDNYGSTKAGNLANYYAGMSYLEVKKYAEAISHLQDFKSDDMILAPLAQGAIGDAFMQLDQASEALGYYEKAAGTNPNDFTTPRFLFKAGVAAIELGQSATALKHLNALKDNYADSEYAAQADLYIGKAQGGN
ncbi:MAG: TolA-binding protein [Gammaproteobacteria bacterium]|jgi:TolA-binding protein